VSLESGNRNRQSLRVDAKQSQLWLTGEKRESGRQICALCISIIHRPRLRRIEREYVAERCEGAG
jgi:hypothetical protein